MKTAPIRVTDDHYMAKTMVIQVLVLLELLVASGMANYSLLETFSSLDFLATTPSYFSVLLGHFSSVFRCFLLIYLTSTYCRIQFNTWPSFHFYVHSLGDLIQFQMSEAIARLLIPVCRCSSSDGLLAHLLAQISPLRKTLPGHST